MNPNEKKLEQELALKAAELQSMRGRLEQFSIRDELTGLYNHRFLQEKMAEEFARASRYHHPLACLMIDIDHFKKVNDLLGHPAGDEVLRELGKFLLAQLRHTDTTARFGGEEFIVLLPHIGYEGAYYLAERLREKVMKEFLVKTSNHPVQITVSIGVSSYPEDPIDRKDTILFYVDKALNRAKANGRNRVCLYRNVLQEFAGKIPELKMSDEKVFEFRQRLFDISEMVKKSYIEATKALIHALEVKDPHTLGHAARVGHYSLLVAREMGLGEDDVRIIEHAGLLHDIGKICIPDEILLKPGVFTHAEYEKMKDHPTLGYQILKPIKFLNEEALIILHHHEWFNGEGYPHRLKGKEIPIGARIVSVLDAYDTMRLAGSRYKQTLNCDDSIRELMAHSGTQFDPDVVLSFIRVLVKKGELNSRGYDCERLEQVLKLNAA